MPALRYAALCIAAITAAPDALAANSENPTGELVNRDALRVCANPSNLPYSNDLGEGFENKIAALLAKKLGRKLEYVWYPATVGFVRNTLGARRCDLIIGITGGHELVQNTNPYYRTGWMIVRRASDASGGGGLDALAGLKKIGVIAQSPPVSALAARGMLDNIVSYRLRADTRAEHPAREMLTDLAAGKLDAALAYGPIAGYWANRLETPLHIAPLASGAGGAQMDFRITMGVRRLEPHWKKTVNDLLAANREEILNILQKYGVPLID